MSLLRHLRVLLVLVQRTTLAASNSTCPWLAFRVLGQSKCRRAEGRVRNGKQGSSQSHSAHEASRATKSEARCVRLVCATNGSAQTTKLLSPTISIFEVFRLSRLSWQRREL